VAISQALIPAKADHATNPIVKPQKACVHTIPLKSACSIYSVITIDGLGKKCTKALQIIQSIPKEIALERAILFALIFMAFSKFIYKNYNYRKIIIYV